jgi:hypothetical protein
LALAIIVCFSGGIIISPKLKDNPPWKANLYPNVLISSRNAAVSGTLVTFSISPIMSLRDFFVKTSLINPATAGTFSLNKTLPTVVSIICFTNSLLSFKSSVLTLIKAFKSTLFSL